MKFITVPRVLDDGVLCVNVNDIRMVATNADEGGIIEGTCAIYLKEGLAIAVNYPTDRVIDIMRSVGAEVFEFMPGQAEGVGSRQ